MADDKDKKVAEPKRTDPAAKAIQAEVYAQFPDFRNMSANMKEKSLVAFLSKTYPSFGVKDGRPARMGDKFTAARKLMRDWGEPDYSYSIPEMAYDVAVPMGGEAIGGLVGGGLGAMVPPPFNAVTAPAGAYIGKSIGGGLAAGVGEEVKERYERSQADVPGVEAFPGASLPEQTMDFLQGVAGHKDIMALQAAFGPLADAFIAAGKGVLGKTFTSAMKSATPPPANISGAARYIGGKGVKGTGVTPGQLSSHEKGLAFALESMATGSFGGSSMMWRRYRGNQKLVEDDFKQLIEQVSTQVDPVTWGKTVNDLWQSQWGLVRAARDWYWGQADQAIRHVTGLQPNSKVQIGQLVDYLAQNSHGGSDDFMKLMQDLNQFIGAKRDPIPGAPFDFTNAERKLSPYRAWELLKKINEAADNPDLRPFAKHMNEMVKKELITTVNAIDPQAAWVFANASKFHAETARRLQDTLLPQLVKKLPNDPAELTSFVLANDNRFENLMAVKKIFQHEKQIYDRGGKVIRRQDIPEDLAALPLKEGAYVSKVLLPLRFRVLSEGLTYKKEGVGYFLDGTKMIAALKKYGLTYNEKGVMKGGKFLDEVFGDRLPQIVELSNALEGAGKGLAKDVMFIKMVQAGALYQVTRSFTDTRNDPNKPQGVSPWFKRTASALAIVLTPMAIAKMMLNPRLTASLIDGLKAGPRGKGGIPWARMMATVARIHTQAAYEWERLTPEERAYYEVPSSEATPAPSPVSGGLPADKVM